MADNTLPLLTKVISRVDVFYIPDENAPLLSEDVQILYRRASPAIHRPNRRYATPALSKYCVRILLDPGDLARNFLDAADIQQEIEEGFPDMFEILRSVPVPENLPLRLRLRFILTPATPATKYDLDLRTRLHLPRFMDQLKTAVTVAGRSKSKEDQYDTTALDQLFERVRAGTLISEHPAGEMAFIGSSEPAINDYFAHMIYNTQTGFLEQGSPCVSCGRCFLPPKLHQDGIGKGYCHTCFNQEFKKCSTCNETFKSADIVVAPCNHRYCRSCFDRTFSSWLESGTFPPSCCGQELNIIRYRKYLSEHSLKLYVERSDRLNNLYCAQQSCKYYIKQHFITDEWGLCGQCFSVTCQRCRHLRQYHEGLNPESERKCPGADFVPPTSQEGTGGPFATQDSPSAPSLSASQQTLSGSPRSSVATLNPSQGEALTQENKRTSQQGISRPLGSSPVQDRVGTHNHGTTTVDARRCLAHSWNFSIPYYDVGLRCDYCETLWKSKTVFRCLKCPATVCEYCRFLRRPPFVSSSPLTNYEAYMRLAPG